MPYERQGSQWLAISFHIRSLFKAFRYDMVSSHNRYSENGTATKSEVTLVL